MGSVALGKSLATWHQKAGRIGIINSSNFCFSSATVSGSISDSVMKQKQTRFGILLTNLNRTS